MTASNRANVEMTARIDAWLTRVLPQGSEVIPDIAVDLADILHAADDVRDQLEQLLELSPVDSRSADRALGLAANIHVGLFTELKSHLESAEVTWQTVMNQLDHLASQREQ